MGMDTRNTIFGWARAHAACNRFVVSKWLAGSWIDSSDGQIFMVPEAAAGMRSGIARAMLQKNVDTVVKSRHCHR
jgi:hypothetical protein